MLRDAFGQQSFAGGEKFFRIGFQKAVLKGGQGDVDVFFGLREVFFVVVADHADGAHLVDAAARLGFLMKPGDFFCHGIHDAGVGFAPGQQDF